MDDAPPVAADIIGKFGAAAYMALVAWLAQISGLTFLLFPELGALAYGIFRRPEGDWARAPGMVVLTPSLTAITGILLARHMAYGAAAVLIAIGSAMLVIRLLRSPVGPAISAGLLPATLGVTDWRYPLAVVAGTGLLAAIAQLRTEILTVPAAANDRQADRGNDPGHHPASYGWVPWYLGFLAMALGLASLTGWRFVLFPPLAVIGFEMFAHAATCPWAGQPLRLPLVCTLTAAAGLLCWYWLGEGPLAAALTVLTGVAILRLVRLHVPPAIAIGLLPMVMNRPDVRFVLAVALGTGLLAAIFIVRRILSRDRGQGAVGGMGKTGKPAI